MPSFLDPLPETIDDWEAAGRPDVFVEVRDELTCTIVGTVEWQWDGPCEMYPAVHVRQVLPKFIFGPMRDRGPSLEEAIRRAERARRRSIRPCVHCGERTAPEHAMTCEHGYVCHGCASRHHDVCF